MLCSETQFSQAPNRRHIFYMQSQFGVKLISLSQRSDLSVNYWLNASSISSNSRAVSAMALDSLCSVQLPLLGLDDLLKSDT